MPVAHQFEDLPTELVLVLPDLRRYARVLTGAQEAGDLYVEATLELLGEMPDLLSEKSSLRVALFAAFHKVWIEESRPKPPPSHPMSLRTQTQLTPVKPLSREVLLMQTVEGFDLPQITEIVEHSHAEVEKLLAVAHEEMRHTLSGRILMVEDEPLIAMDLQDILEGLGHDVIGAAATHRQALELAKGQEPDLILSDIQLADGSSGIDAVQDILKAAGDVPVIFITAFPERLLTGDGPEPAFVIPKPYNDVLVMSAVSQAMSFADTATNRL